MEQNVIQIIGGITINVDMSERSINMWKRLCYPSTCIYENGKYLASNMNHSMISKKQVLIKKA